MPPESHHYLDRSGTLVPGVFYRFYAPLEDEAYGAVVEGSILSRRSPTGVELARTGERYLTVDTTVLREEFYNRCPKHPDHVTEFELSGVRYEVENPGRLADFVPNVAAAWVPPMVSGSFAAKLRDSGLTGYRLERAEPERPDDAIAGADLHVLNLVGRNCRRPASIRRARNVCPHCGHVPLVCPECGYEANPCPRCDELTITSRGLHKGRRDRQLISDQPDGFVPRILEGARWDGSDFIHPDFITKRALDWVLHVRAAPFLAEPALVCTDGMTDEQRGWLERAAQPLGGLELANIPLDDGTSTIVRLPERILRSSPKKGRAFGKLPPALRCLSSWLTDLVRPWHDGLPEHLKFGAVPAEGFGRGAMLRAANLSAECGMSFGVFAVIGEKYARRAAWAWSPRELLLMEDVSLAFGGVWRRASEKRHVPPIHVERTVETLCRYFKFLGERRSRDEVRGMIQRFIEAELAAPE